MKIGKRMLERIEYITLIDYEHKEYEFEEDEVLCMLEDLMNMYECIERKYNDLEQNLQDNYRKITVAEQVEG